MVDDALGHLRSTDDESIGGVNDSPSNDYGASTREIFVPEKQGLDEDDPKILLAPTLTKSSSLPDDATALLNLLSKDSKNGLPTQTEELDKMALAIKPIITSFDQVLVILFLLSSLIWNFDLKS